MSRFKVYIKPFKEDGTYETEWLDVTQDVELQGVTSMKQSLDNNEYDIGVFKNSGVTLTLTNIAGKYSDVGEPGTIFNFRRSNSLVKITWQVISYDLIAGFFEAGNVALSEEVIAFEGLLDDTALKQEAEDQNLKLKVLGKESILGEVLVPFGSIANGDTFEELLFTLLNQTAITDVLTVSALNIECDTNVAVDAVASLENKTVREAINLILLYSNSVLYVIDDVIYVSPREATVDLIKTFYGQGAIYGIENILDLSDYRKGLNRVFNFVTWKDTTLFSSDVTSLNDYGVKKKEVDTPLITDTAKRQAILDAIKVEFRNPKREVILRAPIDYETIALNVLDKIAIDYPNIAINDSADIPLWDLALWDSARYPFEVLPIAIEASARFKILSKDIDPSNHEMIFYVREV